MHPENSCSKLLWNLSSLPVLPDSLVDNHHLHVKVILVHFLCAASCVTADNVGKRIFCCKLCIQMTSGWPVMLLKAKYLTDFHSFLVLYQCVSACAKQDTTWRYNSCYRFHI